MLQFSRLMQANIPGLKSQWDTGTDGHFFQGSALKIGAEESPKWSRDST
jgi:hypothetical protein